MDILFTGGFIFSEAYITAKVKDHLVELRQRLGTNFTYQKLSDRFSHGIPDYYITYMGRSLWLELKATGESPRPIQVHVMNKLRKAGNEAVWADNLFEAIQAIDAFVSKWSKK